MNKARGFTLVEAITVIVIVGILAAVVAVFIRAPVQGYVDSVGRAEVTDQADLALRRIARDLRLALPNSVRVSTGHDAIELLLTKSGGRYLAEEDGLADADPARQPLGFSSAADSNLPTTFGVVGAMPRLAQLVPNQDFVVVYNLGPKMGPADAYAGGNIARVTGSTSVTNADGSKQVTSITLGRNPFSQQDPPMQSPSHRFQLVSGPVMYACRSENNQFVLRRYWSYPITADMAVPPATGASALIATGLDSCSGVLFNYTDVASLQRSGLVVISLALRAPNTSAPAIRLVHQVHVDNTP